MQNPRHNRSEMNTKSNKFKTTTKTQRLYSIHKQVFTKPTTLQFCQTLKSLTTHISRLHSEMNTKCNQTEAINNPKPHNYTQNTTKYSQTHEFPIRTNPKEPDRAQGQPSHALTLPSR